MTSPFSDMQPSTAQQEIKAETTPSVSCKVCKASCVKSVLDSRWVHHDDEVLICLNGLNVKQPSLYDHLAQPDYIDTKVIGEK